MPENADGFEITNTRENIPDTGDGNNPFLWTGMCLMALELMVIAATAKRRRREEE